MEHRLRSFFLILLLLGVVIAVGFIIGSEGITGATATKRVVCDKDSDCSDRMEQTQDICRNPGTEFSLCVNKPVK